MAAVQSLPEGGQQMARLPAAVMGGPESAKKGLPQIDTWDQRKCSGAELDPGTALCFPSCSGAIIPLTICRYILHSPTPLCFVLSGLKSWCVPLRSHFLNQLTSSM